MGVWVCMHACVYVCMMINKRRMDICTVQELEERAVEMNQKALDAAEQAVAAKVWLDTERAHAHTRHTRTAHAASKSRDAHAMQMSRGNRD